MKIYYNPKLKQWSRNLRNNSTLGEVLLWQQLRGRKLLGYQFLRQKPIGQFIADFYCPKLKLVIEIDGASHLLAHNQKRDKKKNEYLQSIGLHVLRIDDSAVKHNMTAVIEDLRCWIKQNSFGSPLEEGN
jgi:very-short-patch-repair endonuclease